MARGSSLYPHWSIEIRLPKYIQFYNAVKRNSSILHNIFTDHAMVQDMGYMWSIISLHFKKFGPKKKKSKDVEPGRLSKQ